MKIAALTAVAFAGLVALSTGQASAASSITDAFLANVTPNLAFLDASSRIALDHAKAAAVQGYARGEMTETAAVAEALGSRATVVADAGEVATGRSVAVEGLGQAANGRAPLGRTDLDGLAKLSGRKFLDAYWLKQLDALSQLRADYQAYAARGDDPALVAMAQRELRNVENRLALLTKI